LELVNREFKRQRRHPRKSKERKGRIKREKLIKLLPFSFPLARCGVGVRRGEARREARRGEGRGSPRRGEAQGEARREARRGVRRGEA